MKPLRLTCPACGKKHMRHNGWTKGDCCSRECYLSLPFPLHPDIRHTDVERVARQHRSQTAAAEALGVSYPQFRRAIGKLGIRNCFPANGRVVSSHW